MRKHHSRWVAFFGVTALATTGTVGPAVAAHADARPLAWPVVTQGEATYSLDGYTIGHLPEGLEEYGVNATSSTDRQNNRQARISWIQGTDELYGRVTVVRSERVQELEDLRESHYSHLSSGDLEELAEGEDFAHDAYLSEATGDLFWIEEPGVAITTHLRPERWDGEELVRMAESVSETEEQKLPDDDVPKPEDDEPEADTPKEEPPEDEAPEDEAPEGETPAEETPADETPENDAPENEAPAEETPEDEAPEDDAPEDETPEDDTPADEAPEDDTPAEEAPEDEAPEDDAPEADTPEDETPADEAPEDEQPSEGTEDDPAEDSSEELSVEDSVPGDADEITDPVAPAEQIQADLPEGVESHEVKDCLIERFVDFDSGETTLEDEELSEETQAFLDHALSADELSDEERDLLLATVWRHGDEEDKASAVNECADEFALEESDVEDVVAETTELAPEGQETAPEGQETASEPSEERTHVSDGEDAPEADIDPIDDEEWEELWESLPWSLPAEQP